MPDRPRRHPPLNPPASAQSNRTSADRAGLEGFVDRVYLLAMRSRLNFLLILLAAYGGVLLLALHLQLASLRAEHARLSVSYASLEVKNPDKHYVVCIDTGYPTDFRWRCHIPTAADYEYRISRGTLGDISSHSLGTRSSGLHRIGFDIQNGINARWDIADDHLRGLAFPGELSDFVTERWYQLQIEVLGRGQGTLEIPADQVVRYLTIRIPPDLAGDLRERIGAKKAEEVMKQPLLEFSSGTPEAFAAAERTR